MAPRRPIDDDPDSDDQHEVISIDRRPRSGEHALLRVADRPAGEVSLHVGGGFPWSKLLLAFLAAAGLGSGGVGAWRATRPEEDAAAEIAALRSQVAELQRASKRELRDHERLFSVLTVLSDCVLMPSTCQRQRLGIQRELLGPAVPPQGAE
jgi:hypothetical protein